MYIHCTFVEEVTTTSDEAESVHRETNTNKNTVLPSHSTITCITGNLLIFAGSPCISDSHLPKKLVVYAPAAADDSRAARSAGDF